MPTKQRKPINSSSRFQTHLTFDEVTRSTPEKSLTKGKHSSGGRNNSGQLTSWWRGGGHKKRYRDIDFKRDKHGVPAKVATIEYDPNRSARIALLHYADGEKRYIVWPDGLKVGAEVVAGDNVEVNVGNALPLKRIPLGTVIHNIELKIGKGGQMVRSAGGGAQLMARDGAWAQVKLPSGEVRRGDGRSDPPGRPAGQPQHHKACRGQAGRARSVVVETLHHRGFEQTLHAPQLARVGRRP